MADIKQEIKPTEEQPNFAVGTTNDPKNLQELTQYVSRHLVWFLLHMEKAFGFRPLFTLGPYPFYYLSFVIQ